VSEEAAIYRADMAEADARLRALEAELDRWKLRVRELEDAIIQHRNVPQFKRIHDEWLYEDLGDLWT